MEPDKMTIAELRQYAKSLGVDLTGLKKKADILAAIKTATAEDEVAEAEIIESAEEETGITVLCTPGIVKANFGEANAKLDEMLSLYEGWEPSADNPNDVEQCKLHRRYLNGIANKLETRRKEIKRAVMAPYDSFEIEYKTLLAKIKDVSGRLSEVEGEAEQRRKDEKSSLLREEYESFAGSLAELVPYEKIEEPKWLNKSVPFEKACDEMAEKVYRISEALEMLQAANLAYYEHAKLIYLDTLNYEEAIKANHRLEQAAQREVMMEQAKQGYEVRPPVPIPAAPSADYYDGYISTDYIPEPKPETAPLSPSQDFKSFDPMTCEPEHRAVCPEPIPHTPEPQQNQTCDEIAQLLSVYPESKLQNVLEALKASQSEQVELMKPYVMIIQQATVKQLQAVGKFCGLVGVTGVFKCGTLHQVAQAERQTREPLLQMGA